MSNFASLINTFQHMGFEETQANYHELQIEYPVLDLLPAEDSVTPLPKPPAYIGYREKPDPSAYHLPLSSTDFIIRLPLANEVPSDFSPYVFVALRKLLATPGRSLLQIATYSDPEDGDHYRFRILTEVNNSFQTVAESELSSINWEAERCSLRREKWMRLISHLLVRVSNRAYFHVHQRLKHYRWYMKQVAEEQWDYKDYFDPKRFFAAQLRVLVGSHLAISVAWLWTSSILSALRDVNYRVSGGRMRMVRYAIGAEGQWLALLAVAPPSKRAAGALRRTRAGLAADWRKVSSWGPASQRQLPCAQQGYTIRVWFRSVPRDSLARGAAPCQL